MDEMDHAAVREEQVASLTAARAVKRVARRPASEFCTVCGEDIPAERRCAVPDTDKCVTCQAEIEAR